MKMNAYIPIFVVVVCSLLGASAQIFLKKGMDGLDFSRLITFSPIAIGLVLYGVAFLGYTIMLKFADVSRLYPIIALSYIWVVIIAGVFVGEQITIQKVLGSAIIIFGVCLIAS